MINNMRSESSEERKDFEPQEGDIFTLDHLSFYQYGKLVIQMGYSDNYKKAIKIYMRDSNFYPNVWFVSDHGNFHLIDLNSP